MKKKEKNNSSNKKECCFYCKKLGHLIQDCHISIATKEDNHNRRQNNTITKPNKLYLVTTLVTQGKSTSSCYVDNGATQHMCHKFDAFLNHKKFKNQQLVYIGDDFTSYET